MVGWRALRSGHNIYHHVYIYRSDIAYRPSYRQPNIFYNVESITINRPCIVGEVHVS